MSMVEGIKIFQGKLIPSEEITNIVVNETTAFITESKNFDPPFGLLLV